MHKAKKGGSKARREELPVVGLPGAEETRLSSLLFGEPTQLAASGSTAGGGSGGDAPAPALRPAWHDEEDDALQVDLRASTRLRKLRRAPEEGTVSGADLAQRLRGRHAATAALTGASTAWAELPSARAARAGRLRAGEKRGRSGSAGAGAEGTDEEEAEEAAAAAAAAGAGGEGAAAGLLASTGRLTQRALGLPSGTLALTRLKDANLVDPCRSTAHAVAWHPAPGAGVLCVGSGDSRLRLFRIDGAANSRLASVHLKGLPLASAGWTGDGREIIATGRRPFFYAYDVAGGAAQRIARLQGRSEASLESCVVSPSPYASATACLAFLGNDGVTILASARTKQWVANLASPMGSVRAAAFSRGATAGGGGAGALEYPELLTTGSAGEVSVWCLRTLKLRARYRDEGSTGGTALAAHPSGARFAVGSSMGVVNEYWVGEGEGGLGGAAAGSSSSSGSGSGGSGEASLSALFQSSTPHSPKPITTYLNLTTAIDHLAYGGPAGEFLAMSSHRTKDALKLAHVGTGKVFSNWPTARTPLSFLTGGAVASPGGGYLAAGNDKGRVLLYRLTHYMDA